MPARLLLFDPFVGGHHAEYLEWLAAAWHERGVAGDLVVAALPALFERHPTVRALAGDGDGGRVRLLPLVEAGPFERPMSLAESGVRHVRLVRQLLAEGPERLFAMYLDHAQLALALRRRRGRTRVSGLLFRPEAHLPLPPGLGARVRRARKAALFRGMARAPSTEAVFTLDPTAVGALRSAAGHDRVYAVSDPAPVADPAGAPGDVRERHGVEPGRTLGVLVGALAARKGVFVLAEAAALLPPEAQRRLCLLFGGEAAENEASAIEAAIGRLASETDVQTVWDRRVLPPDELQRAVAQADLVLAPYVGHVGASAIVMRAAAAGRPLLTQADGLVGWQTREHGLGRTVDAADRRALAAVLLDALGDPERGFDRHRAAAFARAHTTDAFADAILGPLGFLPTP